MSNIVKIYGTLSTDDELWIKELDNRLQMYGWAAVVERRRINKTTELSAEPIGLQLNRRITHSVIFHCSVDNNTVLDFFVSVLSSVTADLIKNLLKFLRKNKNIDEGSSFCEIMVKTEFETGDATEIKCVIHQKLTDDQIKYILDNVTSLAKNNSIPQAAKVNLQLSDKEGVKTDNTFQVMRNQEGKDSMDVNNET